MLEENHIWHPYRQAKTAPKPILIDRADGCYLFTKDGRKIFDGISSWWINVHGHCNSYISEAIAKQAKQLNQVVFANFTHEKAIELAKMVTDKAPSNLKKVFFSDNGSTAVEIALKMAYQYWQQKNQPRSKFIVLDNSYHGDTIGAMSVSSRSVFNKPFWPLMFEVISTKTACISHMDPQESLKKALLNLENILQNNQNNIAGIIIEPMLQAAGGMIVWPSGFLKNIKKLSVQYNTLLIADEVMTGFYRTGSYFACEHEDVKPDLMCLSKGLSGGFLPLALTLATDDIYQAFYHDQKSQAFLHGHTFTANPISCAAAVASMELFEKPKIKQNISELVLAIKNNLQIFINHPKLKNARSLGGVGIIELNDQNAGYSSSLAESIYEKALAQGLYIRPLGNIIYFMPPLCAQTHEIEWAFSIIKSCL